MSKQLGGTLMAYQGLSQDYSLKESIECLVALCDEVVLLDCGSDDGSLELMKTFEGGKVKVISLPRTEWLANRGKEKLAHFTNISKGMLSTEWHVNLQADEVIHENCFSSIREAIELDHEAFFCTRINLWGDSQHQLNVTPDRLPVGNKIIRVAKTKYFSVGDGEGIYAPASWDYIGRIRIYHAGFVRNKFIHTKKIEHLLMHVFGHNELDPKVVAMNGVFDPFINFSREDLIPITEPLPIYLQEWAAERDRINDFKI